METDLPGGCVPWVRGFPVRPAIPLLTLLASPFSEGVIDPGFTFPLRIPAGYPPTSKYWEITGNEMRTLEMSPFVWSLGCEWRRQASHHVDGDLEGKGWEGWGAALLLWKKGAYLQKSFLDFTALTSNCFLNFLCCWKPISWEAVPTLLASPLLLLSLNQQTSKHPGQSWRCQQHQRHAASSVFTSLASCRNG